jgi:hypothetical protein
MCKALGSIPYTKEKKKKKILDDSGIECQGVFQISVSHKESSPALGIILWMNSPLM